MKIRTIINTNRSLYNSVQKYRKCEKCGKEEFIGIRCDCSLCYACSTEKARAIAISDEIRKKAVQTKREHCQQKSAYWQKSIHGRRISEHRYVMEQFLGRKLTKAEVVHHIDGNKRNNDISNLMLFANQAEHLKYHAELKKKQKENEGE